MTKSNGKSSDLQRRTWRPSTIYILCAVCEFNTYWLDNRIERSQYHSRRFPQRDYIKQIDRLCARMLVLNKMWCGTSSHYPPNASVRVCVKHKRDLIGEDQPPKKCRKLLLNGMQCSHYAKSLLTRRLNSPYICFSCFCFFQCQCRFNGLHNLNSFFLFITFFDCFVRHSRLYLPVLSPYQHSSQTI